MQASGPTGFVERSHKVDLIISSLQVLMLTIYAYVASLCHFVGQRNEK
jgi:hypothetical protein